MTTHEPSVAIDQPTPSMPKWVVVVALAVLVAGVAAYLAIASSDEAAKWGARGDAVGPFAALFNAGALFAALWAVHLQRSELALQRQELRDTRGEMVQQRKQLRRTARAQEKLAKAQADSAEKQQEANELTTAANRRAARMELAQRANVVATLRAAQVASMAEVGQLAERLRPIRQEVDKHLTEELKRYDELRHVIDRMEALLGKDGEDA